MNAVDTLNKIRSTFYEGQNADILRAMDLDDLERVLREEQEEQEERESIKEDIISVHKEMKDTWLEDLENDMNALFDEWEELIKQL